MPNAPKRIVTERLVLRLPQPSDDWAVHKFASDPEVTRYMDWPRHTELSQFSQ
jgi:RimJ/RimL family protein N-acetyltransferase